MRGGRRRPGNSPSGRGDWIGPPDTGGISVTSDSGFGVAGRVDVDVVGAVAHITLARPHKLNALDEATLVGLADTAAALDRDTTVKVVVIRGEGRAFSAGFDLNQQHHLDAPHLQGAPESGRAMAEAIAHMRAVTIASIHGHCVGGGVVLAAACDLRVAAESTRFRIPEVDVDVPLYWAGIPLLVRELGPAVTKELVMTGRPFGADEAQRLGFVNRVVPDDRLVEVTDELAAELAAKSALVLRTTKDQVNNVNPPIGPADPGVAADIAGMAAAFADPESRQLALDYLSRTLGGAR